MTKAFRLSVYLSAAGVAAWALMTSFSAGLINPYTFFQRLSCLRERFFDEMDYLKQQSASVDRSNPIYYERRLSEGISLSQNEMKLIHPVLRVKSRVIPSPEQLQLVDYKRFRGFAVSTTYDKFYSCFAKSELWAANHFCGLALGRTDKALRGWLGEPDLRCDEVDCWEKLKPGQRRMIYYFGYTEIPVKLIFEKDKCVSSSICGDIEFRDYEDWKSHTIKQAALGRSLGSIFSKIGPPDRMAEINNDGKNLARLRSDKELYYRLSKNSEVILIIQDDICVGWGLAVVTCE